MRSLLFAALLFSAGCMSKTSPVVNSVDASAVDWSNVKDFKRADGCRTMLFAAWPVGGSASMVNAIQKAGISKLYAVDKRVKNFVLFTQDCITVYGE